MRTGTDPTPGSTTVGFSNCAVSLQFVRSWATSSQNEYGTVAYLAPYALTVIDEEPWHTTQNTCDTSRASWCVEDYPGAASV